MLLVTEAYVLGKKYKPAKNSSSIDTWADYEQQYIVSC